jgi:hypothetical protein
VKIGINFFISEGRDVPDGTTVGASSSLKSWKKLILSQSGHEGYAGDLALGREFDAETLKHPAASRRRDFRAVFFGA